MIKRNGLTMIEIMVGVILLTLILLPSLNVIISKTRSVGATRDHAQAALIAQNLIEACRAHTFDLIEADQYNTKDPLKKEKTFEWKLLNSPELNDTLMNGINYRVDPANTFIDPIKSKLLPADAPDTAYLFKLTLNYSSKDGKAHIFSLSTVIAQRE
jgi:type II secretory pathway pseudopilin PulG